MNRPVEDLALRKQLLLARSSLCRLKIRHDVEIVRGGLTWQHAGAVAVRSYPVRSGAFFLATEYLGHDRMARLLANAGRALAIARVARLAIELLRTPPADAEGPQSQ